MRCLHDTQIKLGGQNKLLALAAAAAAAAALAAAAAAVVVAAAAAAAVQSAAGIVRSPLQLAADISKDLHAYTPTRKT